jgi:hypothetical protein
MHKITNVESLGRVYNVSDSNGDLIKKIQVITHTDILDSALGEYIEDAGTIKKYLENSVKMMTGFDKIDPYRVLWYATYDEEIVLSDIIEYAIINGYDRIILEHLEVLED